MPLTIPVLDSFKWPWHPLTLHLGYLLSGLLIAAHYLPQLRLAWRCPGATREAQSLSTWLVWTLCRSVAFIYGIFVLHDLVFLVVVGADMLGRLAMVALILRARTIKTKPRLIDPRVPIVPTTPNGEIT
jgi:hypothetical protein